MWFHIDSTEFIINIKVKTTGPQFLLLTKGGISSQKYGNFNKKYRKIQEGFRNVGIYRKYRKFRRSATYIQEVLFRFFI